MLLMTIRKYGGSPPFLAKGVSLQIVGETNSLRRRLTPFARKGGLPPFLNYATAQVLFARSGVCATLSIGAIAVRGDGIDGTALRNARLRENRRDVRGKAALQCLRRQ